MIYHAEHTSLNAAIVGDVSPFETLHEKHGVATRAHLDKVLATYTV